MGPFPGERGYLKSLAGTVVRGTVEKLNPLRHAQIHKEEREGKLGPLTLVRMERLGHWEMTVSPGAYEAGGLSGMSEFDNYVALMTRLMRDEYGFTVMSIASSHEEKVPGTPSEKAKREVHSLVLFAPPHKTLAEFTTKMEELSTMFQAHNVYREIINMTGDNPTGFSVANLLEFVHFTKEGVNRGVVQLRERASK